MINSILNEYINGNYTVKIYDDGTKERLYTETPIPIWPESIDIKVTNWCDSKVCPFCFENSTVNGLHSDKETIINILNDLPKGAEIAIGGGDPLSWPFFEEVTSILRDRGIICNVTVNNTHISKYTDRLKQYIDDKNIYGLGISYLKSKLNDCLELCNYTDNVVFHMILGVHTIKDLQNVINNVKDPKVLLLGYKQRGRGIDYYSQKVDDNIYQWYIHLHEYFNKNVLLSFDNLGIKQLNLKRFFKDGEWDKFFCGSDGQYTYFIDLVKKEYCVSSTSLTRYKIQDDDNTRSMFKNIRDSVKMP